MNRPRYEVASKNLILFVVLVVSALISCRKSGSLPASPQIRVKSTTYDDVTINFTYDAKWRLAKSDYRSNVEASSKEYVYTDTTVTVKNYTDAGIFKGATVYRLNARGLAISMTDTATSTSQFYTYDSGNKLLTLRTVRVEAGNTYRWDNTYYYNSNGDLDSSAVLASATGLTTVTYYPKYDLTKTTTLGNENFGMSFLGYSSKHPLTQITTQDGSSLYDYKYTYDSQGRITSNETTVAGVVYISYSFTYY